MTPLGTEDKTPEVSALRRLKQRIESVLPAHGNSLKAKALRGGIWLGAGSVTEQVARFGRNMLLTRLLAPEMFGTMAIALASSSIIETVMDVGVKEAVIQNPRGAEFSYLNAAWWIAMGRALTVYAILFFAAPWIAVFYHNPQLEPILRVAMLGIVFVSAVSPRMALAGKQMDFSRLALINHLGAVCGVATTVILAFIYHSVWALAIGYCTESLYKFILSYIVFPCLPNLGWNKLAAWDLLTFTKGLVGLSLLNLIFSRIDIFVLAKLYPARNMGLYTVAIYLVQTPISFIMTLLGQTLLPAMSQIQGNKDRINQILNRVTSLAAIVGLPALAFIGFAGASLLSVIYGRAYAVSAIPLALACAVGIINVANAQITIILYALGHPSLHRRCVATMAAIMLVTIYPLAHWYGFAGAQFACLISVTAGYLIQLRIVQRLTGFQISGCLKTILQSVLISTAAAALVLLVRWFSPLGGSPQTILFGIFGCVVAYGVSVAVFRKDFMQLLRSNA